MLDPVPFGNSRFEVQRDLGRGLAVKVAVFKTLAEAQEFVRDTNTRISGALHEHVSPMKTKENANSNHAKR